ncbi:uncharacterized protein LOC129751494 [Uranotaenia lowii]|uniref:uncharacterized protein LOC129751494 n=1 Tax=Uranotaenia lowii TaxID=190385 RepID=UPI002479F9A8|nr:uncharacterized protein LOC129751494 [Uranotaenia lowii]
MSKNRSFIKNRTSTPSKIPRPFSASSDRAKSAEQKSRTSIDFRINQTEEKELSQIPQQQIEHEVIEKSSKRPASASIFRSKEVTSLELTRKTSVDPKPSTLSRVSSRITMSIQNYERNNLVKPGEEFDAIPKLEDAVDHILPSASIGDSWTNNPPKVNETPVFKYVYEEEYVPVTSSEGPGRIRLSKVKRQFGCPDSSTSTTTTTAKKLPDDGNFLEKSYCGLLTIMALTLIMVGTLLILEVVLNYSQINALWRRDRKTMNPGWISELINMFAFIRHALFYMLGIVTYE